MRAVAIWPGIAALLTASAAAAAPLRADVYLSGLSVPVAFVQDPASPGTQYVVQQDGRIRVVSGGALLASDFLNLSSLITFGGERGLLGLAFAPDYATSGRLFVNYTNTNGDTVIARYKRSTGNALTADPSTAFPFLFGGQRFIPQPFANHNGGTLAFGPDGFLYVGMGDGGSGNDPQNNAQNPGVLLGKMLRLDVNVSDGDPMGYAIPAGNPFVSGGPVSAPLVWAFGLRNPWKFSFDDPARGGTGALIIADVGQSAFEEIDYEPAGHGGRNYGWRIREGAHDNVTSAPPAFLPLRDPIFEYSHNTADSVSGFSISGGYVYRGSALGLTYAGRYFFADFSTGRVWSLGLTIDGTTGEATQNGVIEHTAELGGSSTIGNVSAFGTDSNGELYVVSYSRGIVFRLSSTCGVIFNPSSGTTDAAGGASSVGVTIPGGCAWTAASNSGFLTVSGGASGNGNGTVSYIAASNAGAPNAATATRTGTLTIADHVFSVIQTGCTFAISPGAQAFGAAGGTGAVSIEAPDGCPWTAANVPPWATSTSSTTGAGRGSWTYSVAANGGATRRQTAAIAGRPFGLTQLNVPVKTMLPGMRTRFDLAGAAAQNWSAIDTVAGRSYCAELAPAPDAQTSAAPTLSAIRADASTMLAIGARRVCFVAPATETVLLEVTQTDPALRSHLLLAIETTLWTNWFFIGGDYSSYTLLRNTSDAAVQVTITWRADTGAGVGSESIVLPPGGVVFRNAREKTDGSAFAGSIEIAHDGDPTALVSSQTTLSATTGLSFDSIARPRRHE